MKENIKAALAANAEEKSVLQQEMYNEIRNTLETEALKFISQHSLTSMCCFIVKNTFNGQKVKVYLSSNRAWAAHHRKFIGKFERSAVTSILSSAEVKKNKNFTVYEFSRYN